MIIIITVIINWTLFSVDSNSAHRISSTWTTHPAKSPVQPSKIWQLKEPTLHRKWTRADQLVWTIPTAVPPRPLVDRELNLHPLPRGNAPAKAQTHSFLFSALYFLRNFLFRVWLYFFVAEKRNQWLLFMFCFSWVHFWWWSGFRHRCSVKFLSHYMAFFCFLSFVFYSISLTFLICNNFTKDGMNLKTFRKYS